MTNVGYKMSHHIVANKATAFDLN